MVAGNVRSGASNNSLDFIFSCFPGLIEASSLNLITDLLAFPSKLHKTRACSNKDFNVDSSVADQ